MAELVELTEILLPVVVDDVEQYGLFKLLDDILSLVFVSLLEVATKLDDVAAICDRHHDEFESVALGFVNLLDNRVGNSLDSVCLALESIHSSLESRLFEFVLGCGVVVLLREWNLHSEHLEELLLCTLEVVVFDDRNATVPDDVGNIHADTFAHESVATLLVDYGTLLVHHVVVFEQVLTDTEVVFLNLLLSSFDAL